MLGFLELIVFVKLIEYLYCYNSHRTHVILLRTFNRTKRSFNLKPTSFQPEAVVIHFKTVDFQPEAVVIHFKTADFQPEEAVFQFKTADFQSGSPL